MPKSSSNCLDPKTPKSECIHEIRSKFQGKDIIAGSHGGGGSQCMVSGDAAACGNITLIRERDGGKFQLMYAAAHCHTQHARAWSCGTMILMSSFAAMSRSMVMGQLHRTS